MNQWVHRFVVDWLLANYKGEPPTGVLVGMGLVLLPVWRFLASYRAKEKQDPMRGCPLIRRK
jgi:hypothetical protein